MKEQGSLFPEEDKAVARRTDPRTSWDAAASVTPKLRESQQLVLSTFRCLGPMTDEKLVRVLVGRLSPSGARTRRKELVELELMHDTGHRDTGETGRQMIVWAAKGV